MKFLYHGKLGIGVKYEAKKKPVLVVDNLDTNKKTVVATFASAKEAQYFEQLILANVSGELRNLD